MWTEEELTALILEADRPWGAQVRSAANRPIPAGDRVCVPNAPRTADCSGQRPPFWFESSWVWAERVRAQTSRAQGRTDQPLLALRAAIQSGHIVSSDAVRRLSNSRRRSSRMPVPV